MKVSKLAYAYFNDLSFVFFIVPQWNWIPRKIKLCNSIESQGCGFKPVTMRFHWPVKSHSLALKLHKL